MRARVEARDACPVREVPASAEELEELQRQADWAGQELLQKEEREGLQHRAVDQTRQASSKGAKAKTTGG